MNKDISEATTRLLWWYAETLQHSPYTPTALRGDKAKIFVTLLYGRELGISPIASLHGIAPINDQPTVYGDLLVALMVQHPDFLDFHFEFSRTKEEGLTCTCVVERENRKPFFSTFSEEDARKAGLTNKKNWQNYPKQMLMRRTINAAFQYVFPDALCPGIAPTETCYDSESLDIDPETLIAKKALIDRETYQNQEPPPINKAAPVAEKNGLLNKDLPSLAKFKTLFGIEAGKGVPLHRTELLDFYIEVLQNNEDSGNQSLLSALAAVLIQYVNSLEVYDKVIDMLAGYTKEVITEESLYSGHFIILPTTLLKKVISRLLHWVPKRVSAIDSMMRFSEKTGIPEVYLIQKINPLQHFDEFAAREAVYSLTEEFKQAAQSITHENDYSAIRLEALLLIQERIPLEESLAASTGTFISTEHAQAIERLCAKKNIDVMIAIQPFVDYPSVKLLRETQYNSVLSYCNYLYLANQENAVYLATEEQLDFLEFCSNEGLTSKEVIHQICGTDRVNTLQIPSSMITEWMQSYYSSKQ